METTNQKLLKAAVTAATQVERLKSSEVREALKFLERHVLRDVEIKIRSALASVKTGVPRKRGLAELKRLQRLRIELREIVRVGYSALHARVRDGLIATHSVVGAATARQVQAAIPTGVGVSIGSPTLQAARDAVTQRPFEGKILREWFNDLGASTQRDLQQQLSIGLARGESIDAIVRRVVGTKGGAEGVFGKTRRNVEAVVRTATSHVQSSAREDAYRANADIIDGVQWVSTLDSRTTLTCQSLDGQVFKIGEGPRPPAHFGCRSTTVPVVSSFKRFGLKDPPPGTRASLNGQVPDRLTYGDWLKSQSVKVQNEALGPTRAKLFRDGRVEPKDLVGKFGQPLTLEQLAKKQGVSAEAVEKARRSARSQES